MHIFSGKNVFPPKVDELYAYAAIPLCLQKTGPPTTTTALPPYGDNGFPPYGPPYGHGHGHGHWPPFWPWWWFPYYMGAGSYGGKDLYGTQPEPPYGSGPQPPTGQYDGFPHVPGY